MKPMMKTLMLEALTLANAEAVSKRNVMVLVPDCTWTSLAYNDPLLEPLVFNLQGWCLGCPDDEEIERRLARGSGYLRCTTLHSGLKSVSLDTLILVAPNADAWDAMGEVHARGRLCASPSPQVIEVGGEL